MRKLALGLVVLGILFAAANVVAARMAEDQVAGLVQRKFELAEKPEVSLDGFPILVSLLRGRVDGGSFEATDVRLEGALVARRITATLTGIRIAGGGVAAFTRLGSAGAEVVVDSGRAEAVVSQESLNDFLALRELDVAVTLHPGTITARAVRTIGGRRRVIVASGRVSFEESVIRFVPESVTVDGEDPPPSMRRRAEQEAAFAVQIPALPGGIVAERLEIGERSITVAADLRDYEFLVGEQES